MSMLGDKCLVHDRYIPCGPCRRAADKDAAAKIKENVVGIDSTLTERGKTYGEFMYQAIITQDLKISMERAPNWPKLAPDMREALDMIASKIARILNGDPNYADSWHDIAGYALLIEKRLTKETK